jgi:hypothetical protein
MNHAMRFEDPLPVPEYENNVIELDMPGFIPRKPNLDMLVILYPG